MIIKILFLICMGITYLQAIDLQIEQAIIDHKPQELMDILFKADYIITPDEKIYYLSLAKQITNRTIAQVCQSDLSFGRFLLGFLYFTAGLSFSGYCCHLINLDELNKNKLSKDELFLYKSGILSGLVISALGISKIYKALIKAEKRKVRDNACAIEAILERLKVNLI